MQLRSLGLFALVAALAWNAPAGAQTPAADSSMSVSVELGDVSATKLPFILAAENGIYARNGLQVTQFITPDAAANARANGLTVPADLVRSNVVGDINIGGGSPTIVRMTTVVEAPHRDVVEGLLARRIVQPIPLLHRTEDGGLIAFQ